MTTWVLLAGLPGTGKSTLANAMAARLPAAVLDKDRVRAALFPGPLTDSSEDQNDLCMRALLEAASYLTQRRRTPFIFFDGRTFSTSRQIEQVLEAAEQQGAHWRILHLTCADAVALQRLAASSSEHPARNRDASLYRNIQERFEPILRPTLEVDTTLGIERELARIERYLRAPGPPSR